MSTSFNIIAQGEDDMERVFLGNEIKNLLRNRLSTKVNLEGSMLDTDGDREPNSVDIDDDGDGLIEIVYIEHLDNIRYNLAGTSYKSSSTASGITTGCGGNNNGISECNGYELVRDLDFRNASHYASGVVNMVFTTVDTDSVLQGWTSIGNCGNFPPNVCGDSDDSLFTGIFNGIIILFIIYLLLHRLDSTMAFLELYLLQGLQIPD